MGKLSYFSVTKMQKNAIIDLSQKKSKFSRFLFGFL